MFVEAGSTAGRVVGVAGWTLYSWAGRQLQFSPRCWCHVLISLQYFSCVSYNSAQPWDALLSAVGFEFHPFFSVSLFLSFLQKSFNAYVCLKNVIAQSAGSNPTSGLNFLGGRTPSLPPSVAYHSLFWSLSSSAPSPSPPLRTKEVSTALRWKTSKTHTHTHKRLNTYTPA